MRNAILVLPAIALTLAACSPASSADDVAPLDRPFVQRPLTRIAPGTIIGSGPPQGWSRLVMKSRPKVSSGDVDRVSALTLQLAAKYFTAIVIGVEADPDQPGRRRLANVAIGLGTARGTDDVIVSKEKAADVGVRLGMVDGMVLNESEKQLDKIVQVARSSTMAIVDFPSILFRDGRHVEATLRHAYLVDPRDGRTYALLWVLDKLPNAYRFSGDTLLLLTPDQSVDCELHVDASKFFLGSPGPDAFAATNLPKGTPIAMPADLKAAASALQFTPNSAFQLELRLWTALFPEKP